MDAAHLALARARLGPEGTDRFASHDGLAPIELHCVDGKQVRHERVQIDRGANAIGHAMGDTTSAAPVCELARRRERGGCTSICGAAGAASAMLVERTRLSQKAFVCTPAP